jgi:hypothetical protein
VIYTLFPPAVCVGGGSACTRTCSWDLGGACVGHEEGYRVLLVAVGGTFLAPPRLDRRAAPRESKRQLGKAASLLSTAPGVCTADLTRVTTLSSVTGTTLISRVQKSTVKFRCTGTKDAPTVSSVTGTTLISRVHKSTVTNCCRTVLGPRFVERHAESSAQEGESVRATQAEQSRRYGRFWHGFGGELVSFGARWGAMPRLSETV